jgi:hypothetical protein
MKFKAKVIPSGNATAVEVPPKVVEALGSEGRPAIAIVINGYSWRSRVARMRGLCLIGISAAARAASKIAEGDTVVVDVTLDTAPRIVDEPKDLARALNADARARVAFDRLPFGLRRKHAASVEQSKAPEIRARRIAKLVAMLRGSPRAIKPPRSLARSS